MLFKIDYTCSAYYLEKMVTSVSQKGDYQNMYQ